MERAVSLGVARMPFGKFGRPLSPLSTSGLGGADILWRIVGGGRGLAANCSGGGQGEPCW